MDKMRPIKVETTDSKLVKGMQVEVQVSIKRTLWFVIRLAVAKVFFRIGGWLLGIDIVFPKTTWTEIFSEVEK